MAEYACDTPGCGNNPEVIHAPDDPTEEAMKAETTDEEIVHLQAGFQTLEKRIESLEEASRNHLKRLNDHSVRLNRQSKAIGNPQRVEDRLTRLEKQVNDHTGAIHISDGANERLTRLETRIIELEKAQERYLDRTNYLEKEAARTTRKINRLNKKIGGQ